MTTQNSKDQDKAFVTKVVWAALTISQCLYAFVLWQKLRTQPSSNAHTAPLPFAVLAFVLAATSLGVSRLKLSRAAIDRAVATKPGVPLGGIFVWYVICWVLNESVTLMGFVQAFIFTSSFESFLPFLGAGLILNVLMTPRLRSRGMNAT